MKEPARLVRAVGLRYVSDSSPGIRRRRTGNRLSYRAPNDKAISDRETLDRIRSLAIPPAWTDVWISPDPCGHLQATGRDAKGRKQYRYHPRWRSVRNQTKFVTLIAFGEALPQIRQRVQADMALAGMPKAKVLAVAVNLLETTLIRIGNMEYTRANHSFGLTTLRNRHVEISGSTLRFSFRGKSGVRHEIMVQDRRLAGIVRRCRDLPGYELFQFLNKDGNNQAIDSADVNEYLYQITGQDFTAKDFRTWGGTVLMARTLNALGPAESESEGRKNIVQAVKDVAGYLGNRPATCRSFYIHPIIPEAYLNGSIFAAFEENNGAPNGSGGPQLRPEENAVMNILQQSLAEGNRQGRPNGTKVRKNRRIS